MRMKIGITQEQLAGILGTDRSTVAKWETGESNPRVEMLPKISKALNCKIGELFGE